MPRTARIVAVGYPHHITQRGNHGEDAFLSDGDRQQYLIWLGEYARKHDLDIWAYCLMANHVHIIAVPASAEALSETMRAAHIKYSMFVNARNGWQGTLWQGRFYSCALDERHLWAAVRYVERNPVRAGMVVRADEYAWSSAQPHCGMRADPALSPRDPLTCSVRDWAGWLQLPEDDEATEMVRTRTAQGLPCGDEEFVQRVGEVTGRDFDRKPPGRPRKTVG
jgi:putative transposase